MGSSKESNTKKVVKGISAQTVVTIAMAVVELLSFSIMSRLLSRSDFGYYAAMTAVAAIFSALSETGIGSAIVQRKTIDKKFLDNAFTLSLIIGVVLAFLMFVSSGLMANAVTDETMKVPLMIYSTTLLFSSISSVYISILTRELKFLLIGLIRLTTLVLTTIVAVILAIKGFGFYAILARSVLSVVLITIFARMAVKGRFNFALDKDVFHSIFNFSGWLMFSSLFRKVSDQIDKLLMTRLFSIETLGSYTRPKDLINTLSDHFGTIYDTALFPVLSGIQDEKEKLNTSYRYALYFINLLAMFSFTAVLFNSELIIRMFFGEKWMEINSLFIILSFSFTGLLNGRLSDVYLRSLGMTRQQFFFRIAQFVTTALFVVLSSRFGINAVAVAFMIAYILIVIAKMILISKRTGFSFKDSITISLSAYRLLIILIPVYLLLEYLLPNILFYNIVKCAVFCIVTGSCLLLLPSFVGELYKDMVYHRVISFFKGIHLWNKGS